MPTQPDPDPDPDTFSPRAMRIMLLVIAAVLVSMAFLTSFFSWLWWLTIAGAVIAACASITPPFRKPGK